jgi:hypothetical protein
MDVKGRGTLPHERGVRQYRRGGVAGQGRPAGSSIGARVCRMAAPCAWPHRGRPGLRTPFRSAVPWEPMGPSSLVPDISSPYNRPRFLGHGRARVSRGAPLRADHHGTPHVTQPHGRPPARCATPAATSVRRALGQRIPNSTSVYARRVNDDQAAVESTWRHT